MKINKIEVKNFKAISHQEIDLQGCSAIITAGNNLGKTSVLRGLIDRFRGEIPSLIVKKGEDKGVNSMELTDGSIIEWKFTEKSESFSYTTKEGIKMTQGVLSTIGKKYFGLKFDIDKFLSSGAQVQTKELQKIVGLDFSEIDQRYKIAYNSRTEANREFNRVSGLNFTKPVEVIKPDLESVKEELEKARGENSKLKDQWFIDNQTNREEVFQYNHIQRDLKSDYALKEDSLLMLKKRKGGFFDDCIDWVKADNKLQSIKTWKDEKEVIDAEQPIIIPTEKLENKVHECEEAMKAFESYERDLIYYNDWVSEGEKARDIQVKADKLVNDIMEEKNAMIAGADIPKEFEIKEDEILYNGFTLSDAQQSSSSKYIAALKLGRMVLGEINAMHFDASFLDKNSLSEVQKWANKNNLQLLIERPDFEAGEIKYDILAS